MKSNELKKGDLIQLRNGWYAVVADNMKGNTRMATVFGHYTETGSVYVWDIKHKLTMQIGQPPSGVQCLLVMKNIAECYPAGIYAVEEIELTDKQVKDKASISRLFA